MLPCLTSPLSGISFVLFHYDRGSKVFILVRFCHLVSVLLRFLFRIPGLYHPDAYIVNGAPGTGETSLEVIATYVFGLVYLVPIFGVVHAQFVEGTGAARRSAAVAPLLYHTLSVVGIDFVFGLHLNPAMTSMHAAAAIGVYGVLFGGVVLAGR